MGISITAKRNDDSKPQYAQLTETAAALVVAAGEVKVWVGSTPVNKVEIIEGLKICQNALREVDFPSPATGDEVVALHTPGLGSQDVVITNQAALPVFAETEVAVLIGEDFIESGSSIHDTHIERLIEKFREDVLVAA